MLQFNFTLFTELRTERLLLRRITVADAREIFFLRSDAAVLQYLSKEPAATIDDAVAFINKVNGNIDSNDSIMWAIVLRDEPAIAIGTICYWRLQKNIIGQK